MSVVERQRAIVDFLFAHFLEGGDALAVSVIADAVGETAVKTNYACINSDKLERVTVEVAVHDSDSNVKHYRRCAGFRVSRDMLRGVLRRAKL